MKIADVLKLMVAVVVSLSAGAAGSLFTAPAIQSGWYAALTKPALNPPAWVFGPAWTTLYVLMGISLFLVWQQHSNILQNVRMLLIWRIGIAVFFVQLFLNAIWSIVFFGSNSLTINGLNNISIAFIDIVLLWLAIVLTIFVFSKVSKSAAYLLVPYFLWVGFAGYLNYSIMMLNRAQPTQTVNVYYYSEELDRDTAGNITCSKKGLSPVAREIPITQTPIQDAVRLLLSGGLTAEERARGIGTEYPLDGFSLKVASLSDGVLTLEFSDAKNRAVGGACRVGILWFQIEATAKQFTEVREVQFLPEEIFQP